MNNFSFTRFKIIGLIDWLNKALAAKHECLQQLLSLLDYLCYENHRSQYSHQSISIFICLFAKKPASQRFSTRIVCSCGIVQSKTILWQ